MAYCQMFSMCRVGCSAQALLVQVCKWQLCGAASRTHALEDLGEVACAVAPAKDGVRVDELLLAQRVGQHQAARPGGYDLVAALRRRLVVIAAGIRQGRLARGERQRVQAAHAARAGDMRRSCSPTGAVFMMHHLPPSRPPSAAVHAHRYGEISYCGAAASSALGVRLLPGLTYGEFLSASMLRLSCTEGERKAGEGEGWGALV